jgi:hypothetical protein
MNPGLNLSFLQLVISTFNSNISPFRFPSINVTKKEQRSIILSAVSYGRETLSIILRRKRMWYEYKVLGMISLVDLKGAMRLNRNKGMSMHISTCTNYDFTSLTPVVRSGDANTFVSSSQGRNE